MKYKFGYDDSLDVVGVHLVSGLWGTLAIGLLAVDGGLFYGGGLSQLAVQAIIAIAALAFTAVLTFIIAIAIKKTIGWRVSEAVEVAGIDLNEHGESAYESLGATRVTPEVRS